MTESEQAQAPPRLLLRLLGSLRRWWPLLLVGTVFALGWGELRRIDLNAVRAALHQLSPAWLLIAAALTVLDIALLGCYDLISLRGTAVPPRSRLGYGALAFVWSNFLTLGPIAGPAIRFWLYRGYGIEAAALRGAIVANVIAFAAALGGCLAGSVLFPGVWSIAGAAFILLLAALLLGRLDTTGRLPVWLRRGTRDWIALFFVGFLDWLVAAAVFVAVLRATGEQFDLIAATRTFLTGQALGAISLLPGGLGSADAFWLLRLPIDTSVVGAALVAYRAIYYLIPWLAACLVLLALGARSGARWLNPVPTVLGLLVASSGVLLLVSTASPALERRMRVLQHWVPIGVVEASHLAGALTGVVLLLLARGVMRGYREAHRLTVAVLVTGAIAAGLKGLDYEEAGLMLIVAALTASQSTQFRRSGRAPWVGWTSLVLTGLAIVIFSMVGFQSYTTASYDQALWWTFGFGHEVQVARFLRALAILGLGSAGLLMYVGLRVPAAFHAPQPEEIDKALSIHAGCGTGTSPMMVAAGDKSIFLVGEGAFCAYRVVGAYLVVFSDPTAPPGEERAFLEALLAHADSIDRRLLFYQVAASWLPLLHDYGFSFFKLGEEATLPLGEFALEGPRWKTFRNGVRRIEEREGFGFAVLPPAEVAERIEALRRISDEWLTGKEAREKQFSVGAFSVPYLARFPCAVVVDGHGDPVAFANLLCAPGKAELSIDLMRYGRRAPEGVTDYLFVKLLDWGKSEGYGRFNFGMAPLAAVGEASNARVWERLAHLLFRHGEGLYNFQGLRAYKSKFHPSWTPRYMAYPQTWEWPFAAMQVSILIAGGWRSILRPGRATT